MSRNNTAKLAFLAACVTLVSGCGQAPAPVSAPAQSQVPVQAVSADPSPTATSTPRPTADQNLVAGSAEITSADGYKAAVSYRYGGSTWVADPTQSKPGRTSLTGTFTGSAQVTNTTPQRQNPKGYVAVIRGVYPFDSPVCNIGAPIEFVARPVASTNKFCVVALAHFEKQATPLVPGGSADFIALGGELSMVRAQNVDEATVPQMLVALQNPTQIIVELSVVGPIGFETATIGGSSKSCPAETQNSASGRWDDATWVIPPGQPDACKN